MTWRGRRLVTAVALLAVAVAGAVGSVARAAAPNFTDADYWHFVETSMTALDTWWSPRRQAYVDHGEGWPSIRANAGLLTIHAIAADAGHQGLARNDERARLLVDHLLTPPVWRDPGRARAASHTVCWSGNLESASPGHAAIDPQVADALAWAWRARRALGLAPATVTRLVAAVDGCAHHPYWRFPPAVANQINWNTELYAAAATVTQRSDLLRGAYRRLLGWFADGITRPPTGARVANLGTGYAFHYLPYSTVTDPANTDVPEYANIVVAFIQSYDHAVHLGMRPLPGGDLTRLRAWVRRLLAGSWTHAGFLNWDTGLGQKRWMSGQYWAFAQQGLLAMATSPSFRPAAYGRWAKALFDQGLVFYRRLADDTGGPLAPSQLFDVRSAMESHSCYCVRLPLDAARAVALGLGRMASEEPPPLWAYDPDTGRLAISTPRYATAIVPDNRGAFPYGGIELARLYGPGQRVAANVGGMPPAAFGVIVEGAQHRRLLATQAMRARPLEILASPRGHLHHPARYPSTPYAGPFAAVEARGAVDGNGVRVQSTHRFTADAIVTRWALSCDQPTCGRATATFPTWGDAAAIDVVRHDGQTVRLAGPGAVAPTPPVRLADVQRVALGGGRDGGYVLFPLRGPADATLTVLATHPQSTDPHPGPSLGITFRAPEHHAHRRLDVRIVPHA